jgi:hypothetical protein
MLACVLSGLRPAAELNADKQEAERDPAIAELQLLAPRDAYEAVLSAQIVLFLHNALDTLRVLAQPDVTMDLRRRMQRDAMALARSGTHMKGALERNRRDAPDPPTADPEPEPPPSVRADPAAAPAAGTSAAAQDRAAVPADAREAPAVSGAPVSAAPVSAAPVSGAAVSGAAVRAASASGATRGVRPVQGIADAPSLERVLRLMAPAIAAVVPPRGATRAALLGSVAPAALRALAA